MASAPRSTPRPAAAMWALKLCFLATALVATAFLLHLAMPTLAAAVPAGISSLRAWLSPPYLLIAVHLIIFVIWKLSDHRTHPAAAGTDPAPAPFGESLKPNARLTRPEHSPPTVRTSYGEFTVASAVDVGVSTPSSHKSPRTELRKSVKAPPEMARRQQVAKTTPAPAPPPPVAEEEEEKKEPIYSDDSMEARWKAIMEGMPQARATSPAAAPRGTEAVAVADDRRIEEFINKSRHQMRSQVEHQSRIEANGRLY